MHIIKLLLLICSRFGGVHDIEESEEAIESEFFDQLFAWNIERNRYFQLILRRPRAINRRQPVPDRGNAKRGRARADEEDLLKNLAALEAASAGTDPDAMEIDTFAEEQVELSKPEQQVLMTMPHPRFNAQLAVQDDVLFIFGGTYEHGEREYTFDEMYSVDLGKLDGVREIYHREIENWVGSDEDESGSQDEGDSEDDEMSMEGSEGVPLPREDTESVTTTMTGSTLATSIDNEEEEQAESLVIDLRPHPRAFESLRDFYIRTSNEWQEAILESSRKEDATLNKSVKEVKKGAFELAETKWWDSREEITALEDQQEEAGVGEVISMKDRGSEAAGGGRRR